MPLSATTITAQRDDELFDVVDATDTIVGQATRRTVHLQNLIHRAIHVFLFNRRGELLLQLRSDLKDVDPGKWTSSSSGHLDAGEGYFEAAMRELSEELGAQVDSSLLKKIVKIPPSKETGFEWVELFEIEYDGPIQPSEAEVAGVKWAPLAEVTQHLATKPQDFAESFSLCLRHYIESDAPNNGQMACNT